MWFVLALGLKPHEVPIIVYITSLFKPPPPLNRLNRLPAEIICLIAEFATAEWREKREEEEDEEEAACHCACACMPGAAHLRGVADEVNALAATCKRLRGVLVNGGFYSRISMESKVAEFPKTVSAATEGFTENVKGIAIRFDYTGKRDEPLDPSLRRAFGTLPNLRDLWIEWSPSGNSLSSSNKKEVTKPARNPDQPEPLANLETLHLNIADRSGGISIPTDNKLGPQPTSTYHLGQLASTLRSSSVEVVNIRLHFGNDDHSVRDALKFMVANLKGLKFPKLKRLAITAFFAVESKEEVTGGWMIALTRLLKQIGSVSDTFEDLDIIIHVDVMNTEVFTMQGTIVHLPGLIPRKESVIEAIKRVAAAGYKVPPFTLQVIGNSQTMPNMGISLMLCDYMSAEQTEKMANIEKEGKHDGEISAEGLPASILERINGISGSLPPLPPHDTILGSDEFRYNINQPAITDLYVDVKVRDFQGHMFNMMHGPIIDDDDDEFGPGHMGGGEFAGFDEAGLALEDGMALEAMMFEHFHAAGMI